MKITTFLMLIAVMTVSASSVAQKITLNEKQASLEKVLKEIRIQSGYDVIFTYNMLDGAKPVTVNLKDATLEEALKASLAGQALNFEIEDGTVILKVKEEPGFIDKLKAAVANIDVTGKVVDENGQPLPGATVSVKDGKQTTSTDLKGLFRLKNVDPNSTIVITIIGYDKKEVQAGSDLGVISMTIATNKLDEVQVQAYSRTSQRMSLSNITTIKAEQIQNQNVNNPLMAIRGLVPGIEITPSNGLPGSGVDMKIQGTNSILSGVNPLVIVDGVPYPTQTLTTSYFGPLGNSNYTTNQPSGVGSPLSFINSEDIESIDVLKDASATAIYGSRAANGAIIITTKKGKPGKMRVDIKFDQGVNMIGRNVNLMNAEQYVNMRKSAFKNDNIVPDQFNAFDILNLYGWDNNRNTDWQNVLLSKKATWTNSTVGISGGTEYSNYLISGTYSKQGAPYHGDFSDQKGSLHFNFGTKSLNQRFSLQFTGNYLYDDNSLSSVGGLTSLSKLSPTAPLIYNEDGTLNWAKNASGESTWGNPFAALLNPYRNESRNLVASLNLTYNILENLAFKVNVGYNEISTNEIQADLKASRPPQDQGQASAVYTKNGISNWNIQPQVNYVKQLNQSNLRILLGATVNQGWNDGNFYSGTGFSSDALVNNLASAASITTTTSKSNTKYAGAFLSINYNLKERYLFELTGNRDGSSKFGPENRYHSFGSIGAGWIFSSENFIKDKLKFLSFGKVRVSYGTTGNDQINNYSYLDLYSSRSFADPYQNVSALQATRLFNPTLQWEETTKLNYGLDLGFFRDRITLSANYAINRSGNSLLDLPLPIQSGFNLVQYNFNAAVKNTSFEILLTSQNVKNQNLRWKTDLNFTIGRNKITSFPSNLPQSDFYKVGYPISYQGSLFYRYAGIDPLTGVYLFKSTDGRLTSSPTAITDQTFIDLSPKWSGGVGNTISYKSLTLSFMVFFAKKKSLGYYGDGLTSGFLGLNQTNQETSRWMNPGDIASLGRFSTRSNSPGSRFQRSDGNIIDGSYLQLQNVALSINLPKRWCKPLQIQSLNFIVKGQNIFSLSHYQGYNPVTGNTIPPTRVLTLGVNASL